MKRSSPTDVPPSQNNAPSTATSSTSVATGVGKRTRGAAAAAAALPTSSASGKEKDKEKEQLTGVFFSKSESAPQLNYSKDYLEVSGEKKGYRMAKATEGVYIGNWYWEVEILDVDDHNKEGEEGGEAHYRLGWALRQANNQAPVGYDKNSYAYRDIAGSKVHQSIREDNYGQSFGPGDVIGFGICLSTLPEHMQEMSSLGNLDRIYSPFIHGRQQQDDDDDDDDDDGSGSDASPEERENMKKELEALGNHIRFFKDGKDQGPAFQQLPGAKYYPAVSLYMGGKIRANFGPSWICDPQENGCKIKFKPFSQLKEPLKKEDLQVYNQYINERRKAWQARHAAQSECKEEKDAGGREGEGVKQAD